MTELLKKPAIWWLLLCLIFLVARIYRDGWREVTVGLVIGTIVITLAVAMIAVYWANRK